MVLPVHVHWEIVLGKRPPLPRELGGRSRSDWVVALWLAEMPLAAEEIASVLVRAELRGSKAAGRGWEYAIMTAEKAVAEKAAQKPR